MDQVPECYLIKIRIEFDNSKHTGQVFIYLNSVISYVNLCNGRVLQVTGVGFDTIIVGIVDVVVLLLCFSSLVLCCRALLKAFVLQTVITFTWFEHPNLENGRLLRISWEQTTLFRQAGVCEPLVYNHCCERHLDYPRNHMQSQYWVQARLSDHPWSNTVFRDFDNGLFTLTGILLGLGALLVYFGLLRYLGFFNQYNVSSAESFQALKHPPPFQILILTLKKSTPSILRFMVCTIILYFGFLFAGWIIIGPYRWESYSVIS